MKRLRPTGRHLDGITSVLDVAAAAAPWLPPAVHGASPQWPRVVLGLSRHRRGVAAEEVLLRRARARRLCGRQTGGPTFHVGAHLTKTDGEGLLQTIPRFRACHR